MVDYLIFIIPVLIYTLVPLILRIVSLRSENETPLLNTIEYPKFFLMCSIGGILIVIIALILCILQGLDENIPASIFVFLSLSVLFLMFLWLFLTSLNWKLIIGDEELVYKNFCGITKKYEYSEITKIVVCHNRKVDKIEKYKLYIGKHKITIECIAKNFGSFERLLKRRLKKANNSLLFEVQ